MDYGNTPMITCVLLWLLGNDFVAEINKIDEYKLDKSIQETLNLCRTYKHLEHTHICLQHASLKAVPSIYNLYIYLQNTPLTQDQLETYIRLHSEDVSSNLIQTCTSKDNVDLIQPTSKELTSQNTMNLIQPTSENMNLVQKEPQAIEQGQPIVTITVSNLFLILKCL